TVIEKQKDHGSIDLKKEPKKHTSGLISTAAIGLGLDAAVAGFAWKSKDKQEEAIKEIESKTTVETTTIIIKKQNDDGSIDLSEMVAEELDVSSSETL